MISLEDQFVCPKCRTIWHILPKEEYYDNCGYDEDDEDEENIYEAAGDYACFDYDAAYQD